MSDHVERSLGDLCAYLNRGIAPSYVEEGGLAVLNQRCIRDQRVDITNQRRTDPETRKIPPEKLVRTFDVLVNSTGVGTLGRVAQVLETEKPTTVDSHVTITRPNPDEVDPYFFGFVMRALQPAIEGLGHGSTGQTELSRARLASLRVSLPPRGDQIRIAHILGTLDDKIELNRRMNRTLEAIARATFKSWFVDFDPVHAKAEGREPVGMDPETAAIFPDSFQDSPLGKIPQGWEVGCLGDIALHHRETIKPEAIESGMTYVALDDIPRGSITLSSWKNAEGIASSKSCFQVGDVLFGKLRPYFHKVVVAPTVGICSTDIVVIRAKGSHWSSHVLLLCSSKEFVAYNTSVMTGTKMPRTNWKDMSRYQVVLPGSKVAGAFARLVAPIRDHVIQGIHETVRLAGARDSLLPKLISDELLVPDIHWRVRERT